MLAQYNLALCYVWGVGCQKAPKEALGWYLKAASQGYADAQYNLALCYRNGFGCSVDLDSTFYWLNKAASQGHEDAKQLLTQMKKVE